jgi:hypothetical protein
MKSFITTLLVAAMCGTTVHAQGSGPIWEMFGTIEDAHVYGQVVRMGPSKALYIGGYVNDLWTRGSRAVKKFEIVGNTPRVSRAADMPIGLAEMPVINIGDTLAVVVGGFDESGLASNMVLGYSMRTGRWRMIGTLLNGRRQHAAVDLGNDEILVVGGRSSDLSTMSSAEIFNIRTGNSRAVRSFPSPINGSVYGQMSDGRPVVCGGRTGGPNSDRIPGIYVYNKSVDTWAPVGTLESGREAPFAVRLQSGRFAVLGGSVSESPVIFVGDVFIETQGSFAKAGFLPYGMTYAGVSEREPDQILVVGGWLSDLSSTARCSYVDAMSGQVSEGPSLNVPRRYVRSVTLQGNAPNDLFTFAISGISNVGAEHSIEILAPTPCENGVTTVPFMNVNLVGHAKREGAAVRLTSTDQFSTGAVWFKDKLPIQNGFDVRFAFRLADGNDNGQADRGPQGADGVVFALQNLYPSPIGRPGDGIGYDEMPHSIAVEFDSYLNPAFSDPAGSHVAVQVGDGNMIRAWHVAPYLKGVEYEGVPSFVADGSVYYARVRLSGQRLSVYCSTQRDLLKEPVLVVDGLNVDSILSVGTDGGVYFGFTSATGRSSETHDLLWVEIEGCEPLVSSVDDGDVQVSSTNINASVVPNPAVGEARLLLREALSFNVPVRVVDMQGRTCAEFTVAAGSTDVAIPMIGISSGTYRVVLGSGTTNLSLPLVIVR